MRLPKIIGILAGAVVLSVFLNGITISGTPLFGQEKTKTEQVRIPDEEETKKIQTGIREAGETNAEQFGIPEKKETRIRQSNNPKKAEIEKRQSDIPEESETKTKQTDIVEEIETNQVGLTEKTEERKPAVRIEEYQRRSDGRVVPWADNPVVLPGGVISKIPRIVNEGPDVEMIRVKLTFRGTKQAAELESGIFGWGEGWEKADDGYYYYQKGLGHGETTELFQGLVIPVEFSEEEAGQTFWMDITVEAAEEAGWEEADPKPENLRLQPVNTGDAAVEERYLWIIYSLLAASVVAGFLYFDRKRHET